MTASFVSQLAGIVGAAHTLTDPDLTAQYATDWTGRYSGSTAAVVRPADTAQVAAVVRACAEAGVAIVPQGGNTGLVGGGVPRNGEVVLSLQRLNAIGPIDVASAQVSTGAGVTIADLHAAANAAGFAYGVDLASRDSATVGGTIATNAGGVNVVRYGSTRSQVIGVEAVLPDGSVLSRMHAMAKDSTGYDLPGLLTGSEGTLAVITAARLRLHPLPAHRVVALMGVTATSDALQVLRAVRPLRSLSAAEWFSADGMSIARSHAHLPDPLPAPHDTYVLIECAGDTDPSEELAAQLEDCNVVEDIAVATDRDARHRLWSYRERIAEAVAAAGLPLKFDVGVPPDHLVEFVGQAADICRRFGGRLFLFGHLAEGNAHVNILDVDPDDEDIDEALLRLVADHGGTISAEHGVGVLKRRWLPLTRDAADRAAMRAIKRSLDPDGRLNPGVLFDA